MLDKILRIPREKILGCPKIEDYLESDMYLRSLGPEDQPILVINPGIDDIDHDLIYFVDDLSINDKCLILNYNDTCIAKIFPPYWSADPESYEEIVIEKPKYVWKKNPDLDKLMLFQNDPISNHKHSPWDREYELVWYIDPRVNHGDDEIWALKCRPIGKKIKGIKNMGYLMPDIAVEFNENIPKFNLDVNKYYPDYWDLAYDNVLNLDPIHQNQENLWAVKFSPNYRKSKGWRIIGDVSPEISVEYNPALSELDYELEYVVPWFNFEYEHIWMLDRKHMQPGEEDIWAFKIRATSNPKGVKIIDYISPTYSIEVNNSLPKMKYDLDYAVPWHDLDYEHVWMLDDSSIKDKIWVTRLKYRNDVKGIKIVGNIKPIIEDNLDVIFISYHEPNAEENWQRVLEKAPWAKRIDGVKGIFNAHKAAAKLSKTDMFYVVDGDAWLVDDWEFDYQPSIFDRDCAYVWQSRNPVNDLEYGNGGVKLFSKSIMLAAKSMIKLDMTTSVMPKLKFIEKVSNETRFNLDEFSTWRSAFRECVKLYVTNQMSRLNIWLTIGKDKKFGNYSLKGAADAMEFAKINVKNHNLLLKINDYGWLKNYFNKTTKR